MTTLRRIFTGAAILVLTGGFASADSIVQTFHLPSGNNTDVTDWYYSNSSIQQFSLGAGYTLNSIDVSIGGVGTAFGAATNANNNGGTTDYTFTGTTQLLMSLNGAVDGSGHSNGSLLFGQVSATETFLGTTFGQVMNASVNDGGTYEALYNPPGGSQIGRAHV